MTFVTKLASFTRTVIRSVRHKLFVQYKVLKKLNSQPYLKLEIECRHSEPNKSPRLSPATFYLEQSVAATSL